MSKNNDTVSYAVGTTPEKLNASMIKFLPELDSDYARFPLHRERWYQPKETAPKGEPCLVKSDADAGIRKDYVYCKAAPFGPGYYSLMCKVAYVNLYTKLDSLQPGTCGCGCNAADRAAMDEYDDVKRVIHARHLSPRPDDGVAAAKQISDSQSLAGGAHIYDTFAAM